jgi:K+-transporting ATPase ATPase A chain
VTWQGWLQIAVFAALIIGAVKPLGGYIARIVEGQSKIQRKLSIVESGIYRLAGVDPMQHQSWISYALALLWFHFAGIVVVYALERLQNLLPFNPQQLDAVAPDLASNTAFSFTTNTSWQSYSGETTLSYLSQMVGITVQSFLSGATGVAVAIALVRGFARRSVQTVGNFWVDLTQVTLYVLPPIGVAATLFLVWQGVPQTLGPYIRTRALSPPTSNSAKRSASLPRAARDAAVPWRPCGLTLAEQVREIAAMTVCDRDNVRLVARIGSSRNAPTRMSNRKCDLTRSTNTRRTWV